MTTHAAVPDWRLPEGVDQPLWSYAGSDRLAEEEDRYFEGHTLVANDGRLLEDRFKTPGRLIDLGCGTGRLSLEFAHRGFDVVSVDLSFPMLKTLAKHAVETNLKPKTVRVNLCKLTCFHDNHFHYAISMFSTLGMIRGSGPRIRALEEAYRILRPGGRLALHAHNLWLNLRDRSGRRWLVRQILSALRGQVELGDRTMNYRGIPNMSVHLFRWDELSGLLRTVGFLIEEVIAIDEIRAQPIAQPWWAPAIRAGGWIVFARKP